VLLISKSKKQNKQQQEINKKLKSIKEQNLNQKISLEEEKNKILAEINKQTEGFNNDENIEKELSSQCSMIKGQIILLEKNNETIKSEIEKVSENINQQSNNIKQQIIEKYQGKIEKNELEKVINSQNIKEQKIFISEALNELKIKLKGLEIEENNVIPHVDNLVSLEEKEELYKEKINELKQKEEIINICLVNLSEAYEEMKTTITPKFTQNLSSSIEKISNAKYNKVTINDENGMIVENERGEYISADKLSTGTIDQLYLSLRLSMIEEISKEKLPIILDETFAYFDENRLEQALQYLSNNLRKHQAIIFTCSNREKEILNKLNIEYNLVEL
jgi:DNA repair exonuclease SbcCD ATPase subunit